MKNLALFSLGVVLAENSQQMTIARKIAHHQRVSSVERRLRRFLSNQKWDIEQFSRWVLLAFAKRIHLLVDESKIRKIGVMMIGVASVSRWSGAATRRIAPETIRWIKWESSLACWGLFALACRTRRSLTVSRPWHWHIARIVSSSRCYGLQVLVSGYQAEQIITAQGEYTIHDQARPGKIWAACGKVFKKRGRIPAHVRAIWDVAAPWILVTNDPSLSGREYGRRNWQEQSFRDLKSGGWNWSRSFVRCPQRMTRLIAILVIAYAWTLSMGCRAVERVRSLTRCKKGELRRLEPV